jgi:predicted nuclease of predicted toxin-antitoxin system
MKFIADEGVDKPIVDELRKNNFDVLYILETHQGATDEFILALCDYEKAVLITQDKDFGELVFRLKQTHHGVVLIRLPGYTPAAKASIVLHNLISHSNELVQSFTFIQPKAIRIRK